MTDTQALHQHVCDKSGKTYKNTVQAYLCSVCQQPESLISAVARQTMNV